MLTPATTEHVREVFTYMLGTSTGRLARLSAAAHVLDRADRLGDRPDL
ncbi:hypothetical protein [Planomonospora parontospora]|nr:hypothetical protein [Planomonospora parontospora]GGL58867.1 hypothetical protein GCM10014719_70360 [Planomonospora parontospora subsp. antibiotica]GII20236.1 hypothetical protein Ppa05_69620 [Planomonospora parontospora subsp. antibiotica]